MPHQPHEFSSFLRCFFRYLFLIRAVVISLFVLLVLAGVLLHWVEKLELGEAIYLSLITALTIGYGDISPETGWGRVVCVMIGLIGMVFTGLHVAVATRALADVVRAEGRKLD